MDIAVKQFYERYLDRLIEAEKRGENDYHLAKEGFFIQLEEHLDHAQRLNDIVADLKSVSQRLFFIDDRIRERAQNAYKDVPAQFDKMKELLVAAYESMFLSIKNENYRDACKFIVIQAETISEYVIINHGIINNWIKKDAMLVSKYSLQYPESSTSYLRTQDKLQATSDYSGHIWDNDKFKIVNNIRNYGSHGYHESVLAKHEMDVAIVSKEYRDFFSEWFKFIKAAESKLYSNDKKSEYITNQAEDSRDFKGNLKLIQGDYGPYGYADNVLIRKEMIKTNNWEQGQEIAGKAISYIDKKGRKAWKAIS